MSLPLPQITVRSLESRNKGSIMEWVCLCSYRSIRANGCKSIRSTYKKPVPTNEENTNVILAFFLPENKKENGIISVSEAEYVT